ncbi:hypothetical protein BX616_002744 [Lobosporangium transversale]|uniref:Uncharacterized protein n=1 Tax=Lobosporangium transversale TaxID=64571 RepID=A0A1Y2GL82_9FUNG|nr:hypothetical protein BCR41DRAFT_397338 [Lobosporangium transversale]KAF9900003.1 hypothetical protein BX616_002744 [Lobosporangium transversale]ORZ12913.1 hypothetical protein BCR41DRAFT_397338 [Lobosporangium transversale]|eukprot:XP_021880262.1 hypothetical protein BCR41DRAFT_397338 [Lobosporangium transversale]
MGAQWKREVVQDHKFDFINVDDFVDNSCWRQFTYLLVFAAIIRGILVYCSDIFTAANLLANSNDNSFVPKAGVDLEVFGRLPYDVYKYLFTGCILLGFLLLGLEVRRARAIIRSRDISYAFTSLIASRYYTVRSYPHFCLFAQINNSKKTVDEVAFFCFFTFRNWKRLILADAPRQVINATILYQTFRDHELSFQKGGIFDWNAVVGSDERLIFKKLTLGAMIFTVFMFAMSLLMLISAVILYIPLVSHIQGNLKEFCCHKIDKRIDELIRKKSKTRAAEGANKETALVNMKQPTLPQVDLPEVPTVPVSTPRSAYSQKAPTQYTPQTPKSAYSNYSTPKLPHQEYAYSPAAAYNNNIPPQQQQQIHRQQQQQQKQQGQRGGYDYLQSKPMSTGSTTPTPRSQNNVLDPYAESAFATDDIYSHYVADTDQQRLQQGQANQGYSQSNVGMASNYYKANTRTVPYGNQTPSRARRYDEYGQQRPTSPIQSQHGSQHGSELDSRHSGSHHSSQMGHGHGAGGAGASNVAAVPGYGNARYARNGGYGNGNEYQPNPRRQDGAPTRGAYRGAGGGIGY